MKLCTEEQTGKALGFNSGWPIRRFRLQEGCPHIQLGGRIYYDLSTVETWLKSRETSGAAADEAEQVGVIRQIRN